MRIAESLDLYCTACKVKLKSESILNMVSTQTKTPICIDCFDDLERMIQLEDKMEDLKKWFNKANGYN